MMCMWGWCLCIGSDGLGVGSNARRASAYVRSTVNCLFLSEPCVAPVVLLIFLCWMRRGIKGEGQQPNRSRAQARPDATNPLRLSKPAWLVSKATYTVHAHVCIQLCVRWTRVAEVARGAGERLPFFWRGEGGDVACTDTTVEGSRWIDLPHLRKQGMFRQGKATHASCMSHVHKLRSQL